MESNQRVVFFAMAVVNSAVCNQMKVDEFHWLPKRKCIEIEHKHIDLGGREDGERNIEFFGKTKDKLCVYTRFSF